MENRNNVLLIVLFGVMVLLSVGLSNNFNEHNAPLIENSSCKEDSLQNVINQMKIDHENEEDGWDSKEKRYEEVLFEYELGLDHLKHYHPTAYKEFHRIIGFKENYTHETERENKKRFNIDKW
jgi:hypothetical protein